jgi:serine/threonine protein kinase/tetratricopeptide (TPR) repeat protein
VGLEGQELGIYRVGAELGRGGMGAVYRATTTADGPGGPAGSAVAVKVFHDHLSVEPQAFDRFRREAEVGLRIRHPNVVRTHAVGEAQVSGRAVHFIVLELVEGQTLASLREELGTVPEQLRALIADQALAALEEVHAAAIVHRDVKPENVVITPDHRVLLMDLGVARLLESGRTLTQSGEFVGSLAYAAPEQFRPDEADVGAQADLYALGVVLYELATGRSPFDLRDLPTLLRQKLETGVGPPGAVAADVGPFWNEVVLTATRIAAGERFASATEMRRVLREGEAGPWWRERRQRLGRSDSDAALRRLRVDREAPLVGRTDALAALQRSFDRARASGGVLLLGGPSGVGKSRLVHDFVERVVSGATPVVVAAGRFAGSGARAYEGFVDALLDLLLPADADPATRGKALAERLRPLVSDTPGLVGPYAEFLLGGLPPGGDGASKDAVLSATTRILQRLSRDRATVVVLEDLHLAGPESVEQLRAVARGVAGHRLFVVGVYSEDEVEEGSPLDALVSGRADDGIERSCLAPLDEVAAEDLVRAVVRTERAVRSLARPIADRADGNPLLVLEILALLRAEGALVARANGFDLVRPDAARAVPATGRGLARSRLSRLDEEQRETLEAASVLGYEFDAPLLAEILEETRIRLLKRLASLERRHRLLVGAGATGFRFASRSIHEAVYQGIHPGLRAEYHGLVADTLRARVPSADAAPSPEAAHALLGHLLEAGRAREAEPWLEAAVDHVVATLHATSAAPFLEKVARAYAEAPAERRFSVAMAQWKVFETLAAREDQMRVLESGLALAQRIGAPGPLARVHALRAGSHWYAGDYERAADDARTGLRRAREAGDRKWEATCFHTLGAVAYRRGDLDACTESLAEALRIRREIGDRRGQASTLQALGLVLADVGREGEALPTLEESLRIWREVGEKRGEAAVLMNVGNHLVNSARAKEALPWFEQAIARHRETGALRSEALALANLGQAQEVLGRIEPAQEAWERALALFQDLGDPNGELAVRTMLGASLGAYGDVQEARVHLEEAVALASRTGAKTKAAAAHRALGSLLHGNGERAAGWSHLERALALDAEARGVASRVATLSEMGDAALAAGRVDEAVRRLTEAADDARRGPDGAAALVLTRLARALQAGGRPGEAATLAREALERAEGASAPPPQGPEIYSTLADLVDGRREELLARARTMAEERARHIGSEARRRAFLARSRVGVPA